MDELFQKKYWERKKLDYRRKPNHPVISFFANSKIRAIIKYLDFDSKNKLLDVGAGNGYFSYHFEKYTNVTAIDYSEKMISLNPVKNKYVMNANNLNFSDNSFDIVFESCLLHHVKNIDIVISEMARVAKKYVIIIEPNRNNPLVFIFSLLNKEERKSLIFSLTYLKNRIKDHNLRIIAAFSHGFVAPNKTPKLLLPLLKPMDGKIPLFGFDNILICEKIVLKK